jgi:hypothetical protein
VFTRFLPIGSCLLFCLFMVGPGECDMTCAQLFENRFGRTPDAALTPVTVPDLEPASPYMWPIKVAPPFILHPVFWGCYLFMATFGVYCMTLYGRCAPSLIRCWMDALSYPFMASSYPFMASLLNGYLTPVDCCRVETGGSRLASAWRSHVPHNQR